MPPDWISSGDAEIDELRCDVGKTATGPQDYVRRLALLTTWLHLLQRQGADFADYATIHDRMTASVAERNLPQLFRSIDDGFAFLERRQRDVCAAPVPPPSSPSSPSGSESEQSASTHQPVDWPLYGGNIHHTGSTDDKGPEQGCLSWRLPVGLAWYARPAVENGRVYAPSPGMRTLLYCLDLATGECVWKTRRVWSAENWEPGGVTPSSYKTPAVASSPILINKSVVVTELGAQGRDFGARCLMFIDKETGAILRRVPAGQADYRMGYAALAGNRDVLVFPTGTQRIGDRPPQCVGQNRICATTTAGDALWDFHLGLTFCEPLLSGDWVFVGNADGVFFCLHTAINSGPAGTGSSDRRRVAWQFKAGGATNSPAEVDGTCVYFGANDGCIYCLDKATGDLVWQTQLEREPRSFKLFSKPVVAGGRLYVGSAAKRLYCLDTATGQVLWSHGSTDWIRSQPCARDGHVCIVAMDGTLSSLLDRGNRAEVVWSVRVGTHPVYADLVHAAGRLLVSSSDLRLWCLDERDGRLLWSSSLLEEAHIGDRVLRADEMGCGGWYQSKPIAAAGRVFIGTPSRFVFALDHQTGKELWRFELGAAVSGAPVYANGRIFVGQQGGEEDFYCLDAQDGHMVWRQSVGWVWSSATVHQGKVLFGGVDGHISCLEEDTGKILWRYRTGSGSYPEPPIHNGLVYFGSWDQYIYALDIETGKLAWQFHTGGRPDSGAPIAYQGRLYAPMIGTLLCCLDATTGKTLWEYKISAGCMNGSPALWKDRLYISQSVRHGAIPIASRILCLDARTGKIIWEHPGGGITGPVIAAGKVYFASTSDPYFYCVDAEGNGDGTTTCLWRYDMGERVYESVPAIYAGRAFILSESGWLYAFT